MKPIETLETKRLLLRKPKLGDVQAVFDGYAQDAEVARYMTWRPNTSISQTEIFVAGCVNAWNEDIRFPYFVELKDEHTVVGVVEARISGWKMEIGYVLSRRYWGQGLMPEAARTVVEWGLSQSQIYRVWAVCDVENAASARVLEKIGMQREGILRRYTMHPNMSDEPRDCYCYAIVK
jgi:RimJ/RimL family protein N-acetyltransferase